MGRQSSGSSNTGLYEQAVEMLIACSDIRRPYRHADINIACVEISIYVHRV